MSHYSIFTAVTESTVAALEAQHCDAQLSDAVSLLAETRIFAGEHREASKLQGKAWEMPLDVACGVALSVMTIAIHVVTIVGN